MINEAKSSMVLNDGGNHGQISSVILVLLEIKSFRKFVITFPDAAYKRMHCTFLIRKIFKHVLAKQLSNIHEITEYSIKPFYEEWRLNMDDSFYAAEFWDDLN